jgi:hypothetical protein
LTPDLEADSRPTGVVVTVRSPEQPQLPVCAFSARDALDLAKAVRFRKRFTAVIEKPFHNMTLLTNNTFGVT